MDNLAMSNIPCQPQPPGVAVDVHRGHEPDFDYRAGPGSAVLYKRGGSEQRPPSNGASDNQTRTVWVNHNQCPAHQQTERSQNLQSMWDITSHLNSASTNHPYRSSTSVLYHPEQQPTTLLCSSASLDPGPGATFTDAQEPGPSGTNDRPHCDPWVSRPQSTANTDESPKAGHILPDPTHSYSASSSPASTRQLAGGPDSSGDSVAKDLSTAAVATTELEKGEMFDSSGAHLQQPNINIQQLLKQDVFAGVSGISDSVTVLRKIKYPKPRNLGLGGFGEIKGKGKRAWTFNTVKSVIQKDNNTETEEVQDDYLQYLSEETLDSPTAFSEIQTLLEPDMEIDITPSTLIQAEPHYLTVSPLPPYFRDLRPKKEQTFCIQHLCTLGPGLQKIIETTVKVTEKTIKRISTPGIKTLNPFNKSPKKTMFLPTQFNKTPHFRLAVIDPLESFPALINQQIYPETSAAEVLMHDTVINKMEKLQEVETYRWDLIFKSPAKLDTISLTSDPSGIRRFNLLTGNHMMRWQIVTPPTDLKHAGSLPLTWNTHIYFRQSGKTTYVDSYPVE